MLSIQKILIQKDNVKMIQADQSLVYISGISSEIVHGGERTMGL